MRLRIYRDNLKIRVPGSLLGVAMVAFGSGFTWGASLVDW